MHKIRNGIYQPGSCPISLLTDFGIIDHVLSGLSRRLRVTPFITPATEFMGHWRVRRPPF